MPISQRYIRISIHTPAWGATYSRIQFFNIDIISIHTPAWGATSQSIAMHRSFPDFNPHSRVGSDRRSLRSDSIIHDFNPHSHEGSDVKLFSGIVDSDISIHTPTRGATNFPAPRIKSQYISIHTPTRGATSGCLIIKARYPYFNPHSHEGSDCRLCFFTCRQDNFNPHSHEGSDGFS